MAPWMGYAVRQGAGFSCPGTVRGLLLDYVREGPDRRQASDIILCTQGEPAMNYLQLLKNKKTATPGTAKAVKSQKPDVCELSKLPKVPFDSKDSYPDRHIFKNLLSEVGASISEDGQVLRFKPFLAGQDIDSERWEKAVELEKFFHNLKF